MITGCTAMTGMNRGNNDSAMCTHSVWTFGSHLMVSLILTDQTQSVLLDELAVRFFCLVSSGQTRQILHLKITSLIILLIMSLRECVTGTTQHTALQPVQQVKQASLKRSRKGERERHTVWISALLDECPHGRSLISMNLRYTATKQYDNRLVCSCYTRVLLSWSPPLQCR